MSIKLSIIGGPVLCDVEMPWIGDCVCLSKPGSLLKTTVSSFETGKLVKSERGTESVGKIGEAMVVEKENKRTNE